MSRLGGATAGAAAGGVVTAGLTIGWVAAPVLITTTTVITISLCWIVADPGRPDRLALLITAWRHGGTDDSASPGNGCQHERAIAASASRPRGHACSAAVEPKHQRAHYG